VVGPSILTFGAILSVPGLSFLTRRIRAAGGSAPAVSRTERAGVGVVTLHVALIADVVAAAMSGRPVACPIPAPLAAHGEMASGRGLDVTGPGFPRQGCERGNARR